MIDFFVMMGITLITLLVCIFTVIAIVLCIKAIRS